MSKINKFSLYNTSNYNSNITVNIENINTAFCKIINEYLFYISDNILIQNHNYYIFIILRGLNMLKHIFNILILYTKNLDLCVYHCKKAYLFYVEFIGQIGNDTHSYLQLNSKDALLFVYKKTIYEINNEHKKHFELKNVTEKKLFNYINNFNSTFIEILAYVINNDNLKGESKINYVMYIQKMTIKIMNRLIISKISINDKTDICIRYLYFKRLLISKNKKIDECLFFNLSHSFFKKIVNNKHITNKDIYNKLYSEICNKKFNQVSPSKFITWLFQI
jgi:hypothetical protein